ncbi:hypothetical protein TrST_g4164 [Triparma strigata]|uniref:Histone H4 n=1 Tax=Triparma strigata TaxID=1606541 RepID=A0A9W7C2J4_9STRA|nr:hypothetical protein TrST_g4164 [Triparma strigata]
MPPVSPYFHPSLLHFPLEFNPRPPRASATIHKTLTQPTPVRQQDAEKEERDSEREEPRGTARSSGTTSRASPSPPSGVSHARKTVTAMDVVYALKRQGKTLYGFGG